MTPDEPVNILLVDDQPAKLLSYEAILDDLGERLIRAGSAREALEHLLRSDVAVIVLDVVMPDIGGFELATTIRAHPRFERTPIIFVSALHVTDLDRLRGYEVGAADYLPVPVVPELLRAKVRVFAELHRKTRQLERANAELERRVAERTADLAAANADLERRVEERTREREAALAQVHEMQKMESLGQLTGGVAHDFNNLLMAVLGNLALLRKRIPADPHLQRLLDGATAGAERGATLTKRLLAFARRQELRPERVNLAHLVEGMMELMASSLGATIEIVTVGLQELPAVRADPHQLELALLNLAVNARDAMPLGGRLTITGSQDAAPPPDLPTGHYVCLGVSDTGTGMDEATLQRASEPFFTTKEPGRGTGLGLSMVHGLAAQSGGAMRLSSRPGIGATVELWLPVADEAAIAPQEVPVVKEKPAASRLALPRWRVLLVEDDPLVCASTAEMLEDLGHVAVEALSAARALELLRADIVVDIVVTDQAMPGMSGVDLARQIRREWPELPVLMASGHVDLPGEEPVDLPRLVKPYSQAELEVQIQRLLDGRSSQLDRSHSSIRSES
ncbi:response regulator [Falsiroseomonas sp. HC035]|uniref:response regulator n=1 Tax=Falsiroseomonas sp. HC035 TaxID=3390999 RepID=UPI003D312FC9